jgi:ADP-ribose pyrophosphatase YjhB (NUDIX family)
MKHDKNFLALKEEAYGGVVINQQGRILLREPKKHFDNYVWTFPKGRPRPGETPKETALREVFEETGIKAEIKEPLPNVYEGRTTENIYFLMSFVEDTGKFDGETQSIIWVNPEEARDLISKTTNPIGRKRDLQVLEDALRLYAIPNQKQI